MQIFTVPNLSLSWIFLSVFVKLKMKQLTTKRTICLLAQRTLEKDERIKSKCKIAHETSSQEMHMTQIFANSVDAAVTIYICISICKYCRFCTWGILQRAFGGNGNLGFYTSIQLTATFRDTFLDILYLYFDKYKKNTHLFNCELHSTLNMSLLTFSFMGSCVIAKLLRSISPDYCWAFVVCRVTFLIDRRF